MLERPRGPIATGSAQRGGKKRTQPRHYSSGRRRHRPVRIGLLVLAVGLVSLVASVLTPISAGSDSLASLSYVLLAGIGVLAVAVGTLVTVVSLARIPG